MLRTREIVLSVLFVFICLPAFAYEGFDVTTGHNAPMEFSLFGGISSSETKKEIGSVDTNFGGGGYVAGLSALGWINNYFAVGFDFAYANNGYGKEQNIDGALTEIRLEHFTPLLFLKTYIIPPSKSPFSVYIPLGAGLDFARVTKQVNNNSDLNQADTISGFALMAGLGAEFNFYNNTFIGVEGRYNMSYYIGSNDYDLSNAGDVTFAVKVGMRFDAGYDFLD